MLPDWKGDICKKFQVTGTDKFILIVVNKVKKGRGILELFFFLSFFLLTFFVLGENCGCFE